jgi:hypothetical protein
MGGIWLIKFKEVVLIGPRFLLKMLIIIRLYQRNLSGPNLAIWPGKQITPASFMVSLTNLITTPLEL